MSLKTPARMYLTLIVGILVFAYLDSTLTYSLDLDKSEYAQGEMINVTVSVKNPYPFPVLYSGYRRITINTTPEMPVNMSARWASLEAAAAASELTPGKYGSCLLLGNEKKVLRSKMLRTIVEGQAEISLEVQSHSTDIIESTCVVTEFKPLWVEHNSTGVTLYADYDNSEPRPKIGLFVRNDNLYPVRLSVFNHIEVYYGSKDSNTSMGIYYDWAISHWDIPALSKRKIFTSHDVHATDVRPIYYKVYGIYVRYPPEN